MNQQPLIEDRRVIVSIEVILELDRSKFERLFLFLFNIQFQVRDICNIEVFANGEPVPAKPVSHERGIRLSMLFAYMAPSYLIKTFSRIVIQQIISKEMAEWLLN